MDKRVTETTSRRRGSEARRYLRPNINKEPPRPKGLRVRQERSAFSSGGAPAIP